MQQYRPDPPPSIRERIAFFDESHFVMLHLPDEPPRGVLLSTTEYGLFKVLWQQRVASNASLMQVLTNTDTPGQPGKTLERRIEHLREKLRPLGFVVHRVISYGYLLLPEGELS